MPNQMIALQARNPQLPDPARATTQMANMMNMASQQRAAQLQGERARQEMEYARAGESRAEETQRLNVRKENQAFRVAGMKELRNRGVAILQSGSEPAYQLWLNQLDVVDPDSAAVARQIAPTLGDGKAMKFFLSEADKYIEKNTSQRESDIIYDRFNNPIAVDFGGDTPFDATPLIVTNIRDVNQPPRATPTTPPMTAGTDVDMRATRGANTTPQDLMDQGMDPRNIPSGMPTSPASFTRGGMGGASAVQMTPEVAQQIVDTAVKTGMMAQADFDQLMAMAPEQNKQPFMDMIQANNIKLQPSGMGQQSQFAVNQGQRPQAEFAVNRGAPPPATLAQYRVGDPIQGRTASPTPGIYNVSPQDVAATSRAQRPSKQELVDAELAKIEAVRAAGPAPATPQQKRARKTEVAQAYSKAQTLIDKAYNPKEGIISIANKIKSLSPDQKEAITGYSNYIPSFRGTTREADTLFGNLKGVVTSLGKDAAAASGAVGNMAVQEWKIAADMIANLDLANMTPRALDAQMDRIIEQVRTATNLAERVYNIQYGDDVKEYPAFKLKGAPPARTKTPVVKGGSRISPDIENILKSRGL
jgi:hypothetical protein